MTKKYDKLNIFDRERLLIKNYVVLKHSVCDANKFDLFDTDIPNEILSVSNELNANNPEILFKINREGFTYFHDSMDENQNRMFIYTTLFCDKPRKAVITFNVSGSGKVWLNGKCIYGYVNEYCWSSRVLEVSLDRGTNVVIAEMDTNDREHVFNMTVSDFEYENSNDILALANTDFRIYPTGCVIWLSEYDFLPVEHNYRFSLLQSIDRFEKDFEIEIYDWKFSCVDRFGGSFNSERIIDLDKYRSSDEPYGMKNIMVKCLLKDRASGEVFSSERIVYISNLKFALNNITSKALVVSAEQPQTISNNIIGKVNMLKNAYKYHEYARVYWGLRQMNDLLYKAENNEIEEDFYTLSGNHDFFIYSDLDKSYVNVKAHIPGSYDKQKPMPIIFALATSKEGYFTQRMDFTKLDEDCLCFDITGRGYTSGSYIGEASIMELIDWVLDNYNIDKSRIYLLGYSNGAFATWAIAQNHPDMFAAIFPLAGLGNAQKASNSSHCKIFQIISPNDYLYRKQRDFIEIWKNSDNHILYFANDMLHVSMYPQLTNYKIINEMLNYTISEIPYEEVKSDKFKNTDISGIENNLRNKGMLSVYCGSMRIVIDKNAEETMKKISENLSKPTSNGMDTEIDVKYPIYSAEFLPSDIYDHNLILLHNVSDKKDTLAGFSKQNTFVECTEKGFVHNGKKTYGDYIYMQIMPQSFNNKKCVLYIMTNNENLLNRHILLRKVVIPSYYSGSHPYWNKRGLLYYDNKYMAVEK